MNILLIHPNFPAQLRHVAAALGKSPGNVVVFATANPRREWHIPGVSKILLRPRGKEEYKVHKLVEPALDAALMGEAMYRAGMEIRNQGFRPDVIYANSGWGSTLYLKDIWPDVPLMCYFEWFYDWAGAEARTGGNQATRDKPVAPQQSRLRNASIFNDLWTCDAGLSPTRWQRDQFPREFHSKIEVLHDGVDTRYFRPDRERRMVLPGLDLSVQDEVLTFAGRGMEPYRGFPQFMQAVQILQQRRPGLHVVVAGEDRVCYGPPRADGKTWKEHMLASLNLDRERLHFTGPLPYRDYLGLLQASRCHVYLTRPFVLSWSFIEAMACGCPLAASDTEPVREVATHGREALLFDFDSPEALAGATEQILEDRSLAVQLGDRARETAVERYDLNTLLPGHLKLLEQTAIKGLKR